MRRRTTTVHLDIDNYAWIVRESMERSLKGGKVTQSDIINDLIRKERGKMGKELTWQVIEDDGGGLHLAVFEGGKAIYYGSDYEHNADGLRADLEALRNGDDPITGGWEMPVDDPQAAYDRLTGHETGWTVVADQDGVYYDRMGEAAKRVFGEEYAGYTIS